MAATCLIQHVEGGYLRRNINNSWDRTSSTETATRFDPEKAERIINNAFKPAQRPLWKIIPAPDAEVIQNPPKRAAYIPPAVSPEAPDALDLSEIVRQQQLLYTKLQQYRQALPKALSAVDGEISDLMHYIEFTPSLNAAQGYALYARLKDCRMRRRKIKNDIAKFDVLLSAGKDDLLSGKLAADMHFIDNEQTYRPRQLPELFSQPA